MLSIIIKKQTRTSKHNLCQTNPNYVMRHSVCHVDWVDSFQSPSIYKRQLMLFKESATKYCIASSQIWAVSTFYSSITLIKPQFENYFGKMHSAFSFSSYSWLIRYVIALWWTNYVIETLFRNYLKHAVGISVLKLVMYWANYTLIRYISNKVISAGYKLLQRLQLVSSTWSIQERSITVEILFLFWDVHVLTKSNWTN